ncbi:MAG: phosphatase PAP2 family protein [Chloroflexota bacterium]
MGTTRICTAANRPFLLATSLAAVAIIFTLTVAVKLGAVWPDDLTLILALQYQRSPGLEALLVGVSYVGFFVPFVPLTVGVAVLVATLRGRMEGLLLVGGLGSAYAVGTVLKLLVQRPRPFNSEIWVYQKLTDFSFPSEHALTYTVFFGLLIYLALFRWQGGAARWSALAASAALIALVGPSRVFLGAHWPSDVLAGYLAGYVVTLASICVFEQMPTTLTGQAPGPGRNPSVG